MDNNGWVKIHRKVWENPWMQRPNIMTVWLYVLCHVEFTPKDVIWGKKRITLNPGQGVLKTTMIAEECFIHQTTASRILQVLEDEGQIKRHISNKGTLVTVLNWNKYQAKEEKLHSTLHSNCIPDDDQTAYQPAYQTHSQDEPVERNIAPANSNAAYQPAYQMHSKCIASAYQAHSLPIIQRIKEVKELKELKKEKAEQKEKSKTATDVFSEIGKEAFDFWQQNLGLPSPLLATKIQDLAEDTGLAVFKRAVEIAVERNRRNFAYIKATAKGIQENGEFDDKKRKEVKQRDADSDFVTRKMLESGNVF